MPAEPTRTRRYHPESIAYLRVHSWRSAFMGLDKCMMTPSPHYNIIQTIFAASRSPGAFLLRLEMGPEIQRFNKLPGDVVSAGPGTTLRIERTFCSCRRHGSCPFFTHTVSMASAELGVCMKLDTNSWQ